MAVNFLDLNRIKNRRHTTFLEGLIESGGVIPEPPVERETGFPESLLPIEQVSGRDAVQRPPDPQDEEGFLSNLMDSFRLGATQMGHRTKQYFLSVLPEQMFGDFQADLKVTQAKGLLERGQIDNTFYQQLLSNAQTLRKTNRTTRETFKKKYAEAEQKNREWIKAHPELKPPKVLEQGIFEAIKKDPKVLLNRAALGYIIGESAAFSIAFLGTTLAVTGLTRNPVAGLAAGVAVTTPAQSQDLFEDLVFSGATDEQAAQLAMPIGALISSIEIVGAIPFLGAISKPFGNILRRNMTKAVARLTIAGLAKKGLKTFTQVQIAEVMEEVAQGAIQDATVKTFDENRDLLENIPETVIRTAIATLPLALIGAGGRVRMERGRPVPAIAPEAVLPTPEVTPTEAVIPTVTPEALVVQPEAITPVPTEVTPTPTEVPVGEIKAGQDLQELDAQIRTIEKPTETNPDWVVEVGLFESLGEVGGDIVTWNYTAKPTLAEIKQDITKEYQTTKAGMNKEAAIGVVAKSGREKIQEEVIDRIIQQPTPIAPEIAVTPPVAPEVKEPVGVPNEYEPLKAISNRNNRRGYNPDVITDAALKTLKEQGLIVSVKNTKLTSEGLRKLRDWDELAEQQRLAEGTAADLAQEAITEARIAAEVTPPAVITEGVPPIEQATVRVNEIQEQGRVAPRTVKEPDAKYAHTEMADPAGPKPPKPPRPPTAKDRTPDDILGELADKTPIGERPDQALLRLYEAAVNSLNRRTNIIIKKGDQKLKKLGIGVIKRGILVPKEKDKAILTELYNALHNPSRVEAGEITAPKRYEAIYEELRGLADWTTAARLDFDPNAATLEDWFFRGWKPPEGMVGQVQRGQLGIQPRALRMPRVGATFQEMIELGFEPLFWNPYQQWGYRHNLGEVYREQMELIDYLKAMGDEFIRPDSGGALPAGWKIPRIGPAFEGKPFAATDKDGNPAVMFTRRWVTPTNIANTLENIFGRRPDIGKFVIRGKIVDPLTLIDLVTFVPKRAKLLFSLFQQVDFGTRAGGGSWAGMVDNLMAGKPIEAVKSLARYPQTVVTLIHANLSPGKRLSLSEQLDNTTPFIQGRPGINLKGVSEAGLSTMDITIFAKDMDKMMSVVANNTGIWGKAKGVADSFIDLESSMRRGLFNGVYVAAMITDIKNNLAIMMVRDNPNATDAQINAMIAKETNKKYSTIPPSQSVFQNTALREILRRLFFSVGESEGLLRQATGMFHGRHKRFWIKNNIGIAFFVLAVANLIHFLSTGEPLPPERYVPISKDNWGPLPFGYNAKFAAPTLPFRGRGGVELTLDLMGQMDTAFRVLDPGSFLTARTSVPIRAVVNQISGTDFYGAPIDNVGPGGVASRLTQLVFDLFSPIGVGQIGAASLREVIPGELIPRGEERLGMLGLGIQATGLNIRAEGTRILLDRHAGESELLKADGTKVQSWADLEPHQKSKVLDNLKLVDELELRSEISMERGYPGAAGFFTLKELDKQRIDRGEALVAEFDAGEYEAGEFPREFTRLKTEIAARKSQVDDDFQLFQDTQELPEDLNKRALVEYYTIFDNAKRESRVIDWDRIDQLEAQLRASWTVEQEAYVDRNTGLTEWGPKMQEYIDALEVLQVSGYWDIEEPDQYDKRMRLRRDNPEIEAILTKWYGYKPASVGYVPRVYPETFQRKPSVSGRDIVKELFGQTDGFQPGERTGRDIVKGIFSK